MVAPLIRLNTRGWCKAYVAAAPGPQRPVNQPLPGVGAALAEAYFPVPVCWAVSVLSSLPVSNLQVALQLSGIEGGWNTIPGLVTIPFLSGPPLPGRAARVIVTGGSAAPGELITCNIAPLVWPPWAAPEELQSVAGLYRVP